MELWKEIKNNGITAYTTKAAGSYVWTIPDGTAGISAERVIQMLKWTYDEFMRDASRHKNVLRSGDFDASSNFTMRNTARVLSYVNNVCLLEKILVRMYKDSVRQLQPIDSGLTEDTSGLASRKAEVKDYFTFRNKVSAHTAYGSPEGDNTAMEFHSLVTLLSSSYDGTGEAKSFALGAVSVQVAGQKPNTSLPCLGLEALHPVVLAHIDSWIQMFKDVLAPARTHIPITIGDTKYIVETAPKT